MNVNEIAQHNLQLGHDRAMSDARIAAFGAIRRAVEVARECDYLVGKANGVKELQEAEITGVVAAASIRYAIRAAIRSEKA